MMSRYRIFFAASVLLLLPFLVSAPQVAAAPIARQVPTEVPLQMMQFPPLTTYQIREAETLKIVPVEGFVDGSKLYGQHCANCHGQMTMSQRRGISFSQLSSALAQQPRMKKLPKLPPQELHSIADSLR